MRRDRQSKFVARKQNAAALLIAEIEVLFELSEGCNPVLELPFPVIPDFRSCVWPKTWRVRDKLFSVSFF